MKKLVTLLALFSIISIQVNAQFLGKSRIINHSGDALYIGWSNKLEFKNKKINVEDVKVLCKQGKVKLEKDLFIVKVKDARGAKERHAIITFFTTKNGNNKIIGRVKYPIKRVSNPTPQLGTFKGGKVSSKDLKNAKEVAVIFNDGPKDLNYEVTKFIIVIKPKDGQAQLYSSKSNQLPEPSLKLLNNLSSGDIVIVANIFAELPGMKPKQLPGAIVLTIK